MISKELKLWENDGFCRDIIECFRKTKFRLDQNHFYDQYAILTEVAYSLESYFYNEHLLKRFHRNNKYIREVSEKFTFLQYNTNPLVYRILGHLMNIACRIDDLDEFNNTILGELDDSFIEKDRLVYVERIRASYKAALVRNKQPDIIPDDFVEFICSIKYDHYLIPYAILITRLESILRNKPFRVKKTLYNILDYCQSMFKEYITRNSTYLDTLDIYKAITRNRYIIMDIVNKNINMMFDFVICRNRLLTNPDEDVNDSSREMIVSIMDIYSNNWEGWSVRNLLYKELVKK